MPQHHPEDRVRVKNIIDPSDPKETFFLTRYRKTQIVDVNGRESTREVPYVQEIEWDFKDGFFFIWGGKGYRLDPHSEKTYPRFLADHCAKNQIQHILNRESVAKTIIDADGTRHSPVGIFTDSSRKKRLYNEIFVGVEEWFGGDNTTFDEILNKKYGGDAQSYLDDTQSIDKADYSLPEEEIEIVPLAELKERKVKKSSDETVNKLRAEADAFGLEYSETDDAESLKAKILTSMG